MTTKFYSYLCKRCGGSGLEDLGPTERDGCHVWDTCEVCRGKHKETYWKLVKEARKAKDERS